MAVKRKISAIKQKNLKRGKLKKNTLTKQDKPLGSKKHNIKKIKEPKILKNVKIPEQEAVKESDNDEELLGMVDEDDLDFLKSAITKRSYGLLNCIQYKGPTAKKRKKNNEIDDTLEEEYENQSEEKTSVKVRNLLPIKTKEGFVAQHQLLTVDEEAEDSLIEEEVMSESAEDDEEVDFVLAESKNADLDLSKPLPLAQLLAQRNKILTQRKLEIGVLSSQILETPDEKITNLRLLLKIMDEQNPEVYITVRKLAIVSLLEVFKDIIPSYRIRNHKDEGVLLKKTTLKLRKFETELLQHYKKFLQKLEKACGALQKKRGNTQSLSKEGKTLGELALRSMCELLATHPYFNFSENIAQVVIPFLNYRDASIRVLVKTSITGIFKEDKKGEITLKIMRTINHYLKSHANNVNVEILEVLLVLKLKDISVEQELSNKQKKLMSQKQNVLQLSKKERKRKKQLQYLEKELLETKAEENKQLKQKNLTEITKIAFGIFFKILKHSTNSRALSVCLEGLAQFAHCINLEYYIDIVNLLDKLLNEDWLGLQEQLHCIQTVFAILSGQGEALNIDPTRFYNNLYKNLLHITASMKSDKNQLVLLKILVDSLIKRRKKITNKRIIGFTKRMATLCLQLLHNSSLSTLAIIRNIIKLSKNVDILLDTDNSVGDGNCMPELDDPEYSNASSTALYELIYLRKHYHPVVAKFAKNIAYGVPSSGEGVLLPELGTANPEKLFEDYDMSKMAFNPPVAIPNRTKAKASKDFGNNSFADSSFENLCVSRIKSQLTEGKFCMG